MTTLKLCCPVAHFHRLVEFFRFAHGIHELRGGLSPQPTECLQRQLEQQLAALACRASLPSPQATIPGSSSNSLSAVALIRMIVHELLNTVLNNNAVQTQTSNDLATGAVRRLLESGCRCSAIERANDSHLDPKVAFQNNGRTTTAIDYPGTCSSSSTPSLLADSSSRVQALLEAYNQVSMPSDQVPRTQQIKSMASFLETLSSSSLSNLIATLDSLLSVQSRCDSC